MGNYLRAYSMEYGTFIGLSWSAAFLCYVYGVRGNSLLMLLCMACLGFALVLPFVLAIRLNKRMTADGVQVAYWQGLLFSFSMLMYACLMHGIVVFGYFELLDHGALMSALSSMLNAADLKTIYEQVGMGDQYKQVLTLLDEVGNLSSLDKTMLMFNNDFMLSMALMFIVAIPVSWKRKKQQ